ncbi:MAG: hypothetical protein M4579_002940 [Chaenotheca gracillima]|nr:MAG: hypothetical protein M4579_002940 [Chaenotheca gracillima]
MSAPQPPTRPPTNPEEEQYAKIKHRLSLGLIVVCPLIIAMPPRKLDMYTFSLAGAWVMSANQLTRERTGRSILEQFSKRSPSRTLQPQEGSMELQERLRREGLLRAQPAGQGNERNAIERAIGENKEDWKEKRLREEREAIAEGKGYGSMIMEQVWEVWNQRWTDDGKKGEERPSEGPRDTEGKVERS